jgi:hypothetical protein
MNSRGLTLTRDNSFPIIVKDGYGEIITLRLSKMEYHRLKMNSGKIPFPEYCDMLYRMGILRARTD